jgi:hypothetical protein
MIGFSNNVMPAQAGTHASFRKHDSRSAESLSIRTLEPREHHLRIAPGPPIDLGEAFR